MLPQSLTGRTSFAAQHISYRSAIGGRAARSTLEWFQLSGLADTMICSVEHEPLMEVCEKLTRREVCVAPGVGVPRVRCHPAFYCKKVTGVRLCLRCLFSRERALLMLCGRLLLAARC